MSNFITESHLGRKLGTKGVYITLSACLIALAGAGAAAYNKAMDELGSSVITDAPRAAEQADNKAEGVPKPESSAAEPSSKKTPDSSAPADSSSSMVSDDIKTQPNVMPVNGEIINPFSAGELVKDSTLGVWRTHDGVDIRADTGTPVKAMNKGTVTEIKDDPLWGCCVTIDHGSGITGYYCSLSKALNVTEGDRVNAGQVIGAVGDTAECEAAELSHLHFALKRDNAWIDPIAFIGIKNAK
ncbi:M23 family metallopeptidase [uncultured Ruminococcus sp.]|uniref:M23 family metallopeptidase n=1 Tax=uncultured Ruminococcus sp. TaxID=165186 RepID=UPI000EDC2BF3|nr:M23 family metallopeptidase [uncultured Ruminococcus sp.]HCJ42134.1 M23 family peptidase [Ruminococcus sp.]